MTDLPASPLDLRELLAALDRHGVTYTIIGGVAVQVHGHRRTTKNLDIVPEPSADNFVRLAAALEELEARPRDMPGASAPSAEHLRAAAGMSPLSTRHGELHVLNDVPGAPSYVELRQQALVIELGGIELAIAGRDDVIAMKRASGRPSDLRDIAVLAAMTE